MLHSTKHFRDILLSIGINRKHISVATPYSKKLGGWDKTEIHIKNQVIVFPIIANNIEYLLSNQINVIETLINSKPYFVLSTTYEAKGKYYKK